MEKYTKNAKHDFQGLVSFHPTFISPQIHFTSRSFRPTFELSNAAQINYYCHTILILALEEKRLESNYQLDNQTMLAM